MEEKKYRDLGRVVLLDILWLDQDGQAQLIREDLGERAQWIQEVLAGQAWLDLDHDGVVPMNQTHVGAAWQEVDHHDVVQQRE